MFEGSYSHPKAKGEEYEVVGEVALQSEVRFASVSSAMQGESSHVLMAPIDPKPAVRIQEFMLRGAADAVEQ